jgi:anti-sigma factor RsiW
MWWFGGHLGSTVSALVDGQLDDATTERAWQHVLQCPPCRRLVEREGWVKRRLVEIGGSAAADELPTDRLLGSLYRLEPAAVETAWAAVEAIEARGRGRRRAGLALVGAGSVSAAVLGLSALSGSTLGIGGAGGATPATSLSRATATATPTRADVAPAVSVHGRLPGWIVPGAEDGVTHAVAVDDNR